MNREVCLGKAAYDILFEKWRTNAGPGIMIGTVSEIKAIPALWYQFFEKGIILYIADGFSYVLLYEPKVWKKFAAPGKPYVSLYPKHEDDINVELLNRLNGGIRFDQYLSLFKDFIHNERLGLTGGIGNLYVKHDLGPMLGQPMEREKHAFDSGSYDTSLYRLILGAPRNPNHNCKSWGRDVIELLGHKNDTNEGEYKTTQIPVGTNIFHFGQCRW